MPRDWSHPLAPRLEGEWSSRRAMRLLAPFLIPEVSLGAPQAAAGTSTVVVGAITAKQILDAAADRPLVMATHAIESASTDPLFRAMWTTNGSFVAAALVPPGATSPISKCYDRHFNRFTAPSLAGTQFYLQFDFGGKKQTIDAALILGHNFASLGGATITLQVADSQDFATNLRTLATWSPGTSTKRLVNLNLGGTQASYSAVEFVRLSIAIPAPGGIPQIGELVLSTREQLGVSPLLPYDPDHQQSRVSDFEARSGVRWRYVFNQGQQVLAPGARASGAADWAPVTGTWADTVQGTKPFAWIERPNTVPGAAYWMFMEKPEFIFPYETDQVRHLAMSMVEQAGPFYSQEA